MISTNIYLAGYQVGSFGPWLAKAHLRIAETVRDLVGSHTSRSGSVGPKVNFIYRFWSDFSVPLSVVPHSVSHQPQPEHKVRSVSSSYLCIWMVNAWEKESLLEKSLRQVRRKHCQQMSPRLLPDCCPLPFRPCGILRTFLLFQRLRTKVQTRPLVTGLTRDLLHLWTTFSQRK